MDWNCKISDERLSEYLDGKLPAADASAFATHTAGCADCAQLVARVGRLVGQMHELAEIEEPPQLIQKHPRRDDWPTHPKRRLEELVLLGADAVAAAVRNGHRDGRRVTHYRDPLHRHNTGEDQARRLEPREHLPFSESAAASHLRSQREICERPASGLRNSVAAATRSRACAQFSPCARAKAIATGSFHAAAKVR